MKKLLITFLLFSSYQLYSQEQVPEIYFSKALSEKNLPAKFYKGKTTLLEFWATWCAPCIAGFPHINALTKNSKLKDINLVSITSEKDLLKIEKSLQRNPLYTINLIDDDRKTAKAFSVQSLPTTVILNKKGEEVWRGYYSEVTDSLLLAIDLGTYQPPKKTANLPVNNTSEKTNIITNTFKVSLSIDQNVKGFGKALSNSEMSWSADTWSFQNFVGIQLLQFTPVRIKSDIKDFNIDLNYVHDKNLTAPNEVLLDSLKKIFKFKTEVLDQEEDVIVLKVTDQEKFKNAHSLQDPAGRASTIIAKDQYVFINKPFKEICRLLEFNMPHFFLNDANLDKYKLDLKLPVTNDLKLLNSYLEENYGIKFFPERQKIQILKILNLYIRNQS